VFVGVGCIWLGGTLMRAVWSASEIGESKD
jgi:hypothetical protein